MRSLRLAIGLFFLCGTAACVGEHSSYLSAAPSSHPAGDAPAQAPTATDGGTAAAPVPCWTAQTTPTPGPAPLRRLSRAEYNRTVADLLGDTTRPADAFPADGESHGFSNQAELLTVSPALLEAQLQAARAVSAKAAADLPRLRRELGPATADAEAQLENAPDDLPTRERLTRVTSSSQCMSCHRTLNPLGFSFEHYDTLGRWREQDQGVPVDASGGLYFVDAQVDGPVMGVPALAERIADSELFTACAVRQLFRFGYGRDPTEADACTVEQLQHSFASSDGNMRELLLFMTQLDAFRFRPTHTAQ